MNFSYALAGRVALVIGNAKYDDVPLENSTHDAEDIASLLTRLNFEVLTLKDGTQQQMEEVIERFSLRLSQQDAGLFYYAGHGVQANGINYLIPIKSGIHSLSDLRYKAVDSQYVLDKMEAARVKTSIFILDACRDNPFRGMRGGSRGLANMNGPNGTIIAFSTSPGNTAADGEGRNGLYTQYLLEHMSTPGISILELFQRVRIDVDRASQGLQIPWESSSLRQSFCFVSCAPSTKYVDPHQLEAVTQEKEQLARELTQIKSIVKEKQHSTKAIEQLQQEKNKLEQELASLQQAHDVNVKNELELKKLKQHELEIEQSLKNKQQTEVEKERLSTEKNQLIQDKSLLTEKISRYEADQSQKLDALARLQQENSRLTAELQKQSMEKQNLSSEQVKGINQQLKELERIKTEKDDLQTRLENKIKTIQSENNEHKEILERVQQEKDILQAELKNKQNTTTSVSRTEDIAPIGGF